MKILDDAFDLIEIRAARNLMECDHYWKHHLHRVPASRVEFTPKGFLPRMRRVLDAITLRGGLR
jgi:hypothetical protein